MLLYTERVTPLYSEGHGEPKQRPETLIPFLSRGNKEACTVQVVCNLWGYPSSQWGGGYFYDRGPGCQLEEDL